MGEQTEVRDLLPAWALDAVDDVDRARIERAIRQDPSLAGEARSLVETAARLAESGSTPPPPALRARVLTAVDSVPQQPPATSPAVRSPRPPRRRVATWIVTAAVTTMAVIAPSVLAVQQAGRAARAEREVALFAEALAEPGARVLAADVSGGGQAIAVISESGILFTARGLPHLDSELGYQLWLIDEDATVSAGILEVGGGVAQVKVNQASPGSTLSLTVEPAAGSRQPTTAPLVLLPEAAPADPEESGEAGAA
jgi:hypothetical protein